MMHSDLMAALRDHLKTLDEDSIGITERLSVGRAPADPRTLAGVPADDRPADVARTVQVDSLPVPASRSLAVNPAFASLRQ